ncbi:hypothetical protein FE257_003595 [Aspergillus nanangensis]|uniref:Uncharacterized protein n=1 Tax=Aspergillus nanangensis TaxID=2582783 RepID=A0AAD4GVD3_ASPNN|nr:hypothetical protein FE257_003595 [Aspergillus nanangensis]
MHIYKSILIHLGSLTLVASQDQDTQIRVQEVGYDYKFFIRVWSDVGCQQTGLSGYGNPSSYGTETH